MLSYLVPILVLGVFHRFALAQVIVTAGNISSNNPGANEPDFPTRELSKSSCLFPTDIFATDYFSRNFTALPDTFRPVLRKRRLVARFRRLFRNAMSKIRDVFLEVGKSRQFLFWSSDLRLSSPEFSRVVFPEKTGRELPPGAVVQECRGKRFSWAGQYGYSPRA